MKLIFAVINNDDVRFISDALVSKDFQATRLSSTGSFLKSGNTTILICIDDDKVDTAIEVIRSHCRKRKQLLPSHAVSGAFST